VASEPVEVRIAGKLAVQQIPTGSECRQIRLDVGWSCADVADLVGSHRQSVSEWERDIRRPRGRVAIEYLRVLQLMTSIVEAADSSVETVSSDV
jgi:DNA-binding transcriptional regulator YiaG